jgi:AcrR family transcriptional regulator
MRTNSPGHATVPAPGPDRGVRGRTYEQLLSCAMKLAQDGRLVTVAEVAAAAGVGRATAYRYFASRSQLIAAIVERSLGPVRRFESSATDGRARLQQLFIETFPRFKEFEPHMRAALQVSLEHWALERSGRLDEEPYRRGHRVAILTRAAAPLKAQMPANEYRRLLCALSIIYGIEPYIVLKDIWGSSNREVDQIARWMANALVDAALKGKRHRRTQQRKLT